MNPIILRSPLALTIKLTEAHETVRRIYTPERFKDAVETYGKIIEDIRDNPKHQVSGTLGAAIALAKRLKEEGAPPMMVLVALAVGVELSNREDE